MSTLAFDALFTDGRIRIASGWTGFGPVCPQSVHQNCGYLTLSTGVTEIDAVLPGGGLKAVATHEWFAPATEGSARGAWAPPLTVMLHLALRGKGEGLVVWIGRRCWPMPAVLG